jgi:hypothetical protein
MKQCVVLAGGLILRQQWSLCHFQEQMNCKTCFILSVLYDYDYIVSTQGEPLVINIFNCRWSAAPYCSLLPAGHKIIELADYCIVPFLCRVFITITAPTLLHVVTISMECAQLSPAYRARVDLAALALLYAMPLVS